MAAVTIRDIPMQFDMRGACNCCKSACCVTARDVAYITHDQKVESFSPKKSAVPHVDYEKSITRVRSFVNRYIETLVPAMDASELRADIEAVLMHKTRLTFGDINDINEILYTFYRTIRGPYGSPST